ncbi:MAG: DUF2190 family protein [Ahrensia sp.]|nr:DUF2190 family protein [Ahrensia sp.]
MNMFNSVLNGLNWCRHRRYRGDRSCLALIDVAVAAAVAPVKGIALNPAAAGEAFPVMLTGMIRIKADGAITAGDKIVSSATKGSVQGGRRDTCQCVCHCAYTRQPTGRFC